MHWIGGIEHSLIDCILHDTVVSILGTPRREGGRASATRWHGHGVRSWSGIGLEYCVCVCVWRNFPGMDSTYCYSVQCVVAQDGYSTERQPASHPLRIWFPKKQCGHVCLRVYLFGLSFFPSSCTERGSLPLLIVCGSCLVSCVLLLLLLKQYYQSPLWAIHPSPSSRCPCLSQPNSYPDPGPVQAKPPSSRLSSCYGLSLVNFL
jgi:hypothetical protein